MSKRTSTGWSAVALVCSALLALLWAAPLLWALSTALRTEEGTVALPLSYLPQEWTSAAFSKVLALGNMPLWVVNSALVALAVTVLTVGIGIMAAYAFSQLRFAGRNALFWLAMLAFMLPFEALLIPLFRLMYKLGMIDTYAGLILPQIVSPVVIYVFRQFFDSIPADFREAAVLDGATPARVLWHVYLPLSANIVWAMAIVGFIGAWNNFLWQFIVVASSEMMTIPLGLTQTQDAFGVRDAQQMAAALMGGLPVALAYLVFQRRVSHGFLAATGLKG